LMRKGGAEVCSGSGKKGDWAVFGESGSCIKGVASTTVRAAIAVRLCRARR